MEEGPPTQHLLAPMWQALLIKIAKRPSVLMYTIAKTRAAKMMMLWVGIR
jgi:hypothetical protein